MRDPRWTVVAGGALVIAVMIGTAVVATRPGLSPTVRVVLFVVMLAVMVIGGMLTLRDWSTPRRRR